MAITSRRTAVTLLAAAQLLLLLSSCSGWRLTSAESGAGADESGEVVTYLMPVLRYGPNNQKRDLRQMIAIAKQLDCGLVLTGLYKHYRDTREASAEAEKKSKGKFQSKFNGSSAAAAVRTLHAKQKPPPLRAGKATGSPSSAQQRQQAGKGGEAGRLLHAWSNDGSGHAWRGAGAWNSSSSGGGRRTGRSGGRAASGGHHHATRKGSMAMAEGGRQQQHAIRSGIAAEAQPSWPADDESLARLPNTVRQQLRAIARTGTAASSWWLPQGKAGALHSGGRGARQLHATITTGSKGRHQLRAAAGSEVGNGVHQLRAAAGSVSTKTPRHVVRQLHATTATTGSNVAKAGPSQVVKAEGKELDLPRCFEYKYQHFLDFGNVLDAEPIDAYVPVASVGELKAMGWDGVIDAFMFREGHGPDESSNNQWHMTKTLRSLGINIASNFARLPVKVPVRCDPKAVADLKLRVQKFRVVALLLFTLDESEFPDYGKIMGPAPTTAGAKGECQRSLWQTERMLRPAPWIQQLAARYINESFGGTNFLAVHVRPFPDECLDVWKLPKLEDKDLKKHCSGNTVGLHHSLGPKIRDRLQGHPGVKQVFIMSHPAIRHNIDAVLAKDPGNKARMSYLDEHTLTRLAGCVDHSATFMAMAEEEVAVQADLFLGTAGSSITHSIVAERMGLDHTDITFLDM